MELPANVIRNAFKTLGLTSAHADVYQTCLAIGSASANTIAQATKITRNNIYTYINELRRLGLLEEEFQGSKGKIYTAVSPDKIGRMLDEREEFLETTSDDFYEHLGDLRTLYYSHKPNFPKTQHFSGAIELEKLLTELLKEKQILILNLGQLDSEPAYFKFFREQIAFLQVPAKLICEYNQFGVSYKEEFSSRNYDITLIPANISLGPTQKPFSKIIAGDKVVSIFHAEVLAFVVINTSFSDQERAQFEMQLQEAQDRN